jgi:nucleotide-binding universal stress UspA family protein
MNNSRPNSAVVVGIDGSDAAIKAAVWAIDEAINRDVPLRLIHAVPAANPGSLVDDFSLALEYAETALRTADAALATTNRPVKVETAIVRGSPQDALINESHSAAMVCVGSIGIGRVAATLLGSTAAAVATAAHCPVAIVRSQRGTPAAHTGWIVAAVADTPHNDAVVGQGFAEATLRNAGLIVVARRSWTGEAQLSALLDRSVDRWSARYPDVVAVRIELSAISIAQFLAGSQDPVQLAVVDSCEAHLFRFIDPVGGASLLDHAECSVLVVRDHLD